jgi:hypothetical protein
VLVALSEEAGRRGEGEFYASYHMIGALMGLVDNDKKVQRHVRALGQMGYISLLAAGDRGTVPGRMASRWSRWNTPARPGETLWNDHRAMGKGWARRPAASAAEVPDVAMSKTDGPDAAVAGFLAGAGPDGPGPADPAGPVGDQPAPAGPDDLDVDRPKDDAAASPAPAVSSSLLEAVLDLVERPAGPSSSWDELAARRWGPGLDARFEGPGIVVDRHPRPTLPFDSDDDDRAERAAIMEVDGGLSREAAERAAGYVPFF